MARQNVNTGTTANDGSGDTLRGGAAKINDNFIELYNLLGGDSAQITNKVSLGDSGVVFNGLTYNTTLGWIEGGSDFTIKLPSSGATLVGDTTIQTLGNKTLTAPVLTTPQINDTSANHQYIFAVNELTADRTITLPLLAGDDEVVFKNHTQTLTNKTFSSPTLNNPLIGGGIVDSNGAEFMHFSTTASAVNSVNIVNAATGGTPVIATFSEIDTNVNLGLAAQGDAFIDLQSSLRMRSEAIVADAQTILLDRPLSRFNATTDITATLTDGRTVGEIKYLLNDATTNTVTVTPTNFILGTSFTLRADAFAMLIWSGGHWHLHIDQAYPSSNTDVLVYVTP